MGLVPGTPTCQSKGHCVVVKHPCGSILFFFSFLFFGTLQWMERFLCDGLNGRFKRSSNHFHTMRNCSYSSSTFTRFTRRSAMPSSSTSIAASRLALTIVIRRVSSSTDTPDSAFAPNFDILRAALLILSMPFSVVGDMKSLCSRIDSTTFSHDARTSWRRTAMLFCSTAISSSWSKKSHFADRFANRLRFREQRTSWDRMISAAVTGSSLGINFVSDAAVPSNTDILRASSWSRIFCLPVSLSSTLLPVSKSMPWLLEIALRSKMEDL
mmetsp:Transcript_21879/g.43415  ORF Transcript_21879/g.43415 Transcript_21879/m.43415 type:complete len:269 (-) Transcript_21879:95-901(-)